VNIDFLDDSALEMHTNGKSLVVALDQGVCGFTINSGNLLHDLELVQKIRYPEPGTISSISPNGQTFVHCARDAIYLWQEKSDC
jgi:hypothetical protein